MVKGKKKRKEKKYLNISKCEWNVMMPSKLHKLDSSCYPHILTLTPYDLNVLNN
jgi:hypothetical protein